MIIAGPINAGPGAAAGVSKGPAVKHVMPADTLEAFASNRKLREQLEEVRSTVASAKAQVEAAEEIPRAQVRLQASADSWVPGHNSLNLSAAGALSAWRGGLPIPALQAAQGLHKLLRSPAGCVVASWAADSICGPI